MATETTIELGTDFYRDPHSVCRELRADGGVHRVRFANGMVGWLVTDYDTVKQVLVDPAVRKDAFSDAGNAARENAGQSGVGTMLNRHLVEHMLNADPPKHTRLRALVNKAFTSRAVRSAIRSVMYSTSRSLAERISSGVTSLTMALDQSRTSSRSATGTPSSSQITVIGSGNA